MKEPCVIDRRSLIALLAGATITVVGCDSESDGPAAASTRTPDRIGEISDNHQHLARLGGPQVAAGQALMLSIRGNANHDHMVAFTADDVQRLRGGERVNKTSTSEQGHQHTVIFN